jgi:hypothetical protein
MSLLDSIVGRCFRDEKAGRVVVFVGNRRHRGYVVKSEAEELKIRSFLKMFCFASLSILLLGYVLAFESSMQLNYALGRPARHLLRTGAITFGIFFLVQGLPYLAIEILQEGFLKLCFGPGRGCGIGAGCQSAALDCCWPDRVRYLNTSWGYLPRFGQVASVLDLLIQYSRKSCPTLYPSQKYASGLSIILRPGAPSLRSLKGWEGLTFLVRAQTTQSKRARCFSERRDFAGAGAPSGPSICWNCSTVAGV